MFLMLVLFGRLGMQDLLVQELHNVFSRPMFSHETRLIFSHLPRDLAQRPFLDPMEAMQFTDLIRRKHLRVL